MPSVKSACVFESATGLMTLLGEIIYANTASPMLGFADIAVTFDKCGNSTVDEKLLQEAISQKMPFGKYAGRYLLELPEPYLVWFHSKGFPEGKLGQQLALMYEVKLNGLEGMLQPLLDKVKQARSR